MATRIVCTTSKPCEFKKVDGTCGWKWGGHCAYSRIIETKGTKKC